MKEIKLSKGMVALVDDEDYEYLNQFKWYLTHSHYKHYYAIRSVCVNKKYKSIRMHRDIMMPNHNQEIDHIDHNGLNNQKLNLRICSRAENSRNRTPIGESKYLGVSYVYSKYKDKIYSSIRAYITIKDKYIHLGCFKNEIDAAKCYDHRAKIEFGEFANLNFKKRS